MIGRKIFHEIIISWSYRIRGKEPRTQIKINDIIIIFQERDKVWKKNWLELIKKIEVIILIDKILVYSAIKIKANLLLLYSRLKPDTNSDSPSDKSKGVRFVSARIVENQMKKRKGNIISIGVIKFIIMINKLKDIYIISNDKIIKDILTS